MKLVSVIIPAYNVEAYIATTIQSVLNQTYRHFEILVVDDGSPDRSKEICKQFNDPRIKILEQENQGVSAARNRGIRHSKGDYLAFLDGDDLWKPKKLEKHVQHLNHSPDVGVSFSRFAFIDETGKSLGIIKLSKTEGITPKLILCRTPVGNPSCIMIRKEVVDRVKYYNTQSCATTIYFDEELSQFEDVDFCLRIALQTDWKIIGLPDALTLYRINPEGASADAVKQLDGLSKLLDRTSYYASDLVKQYGSTAQAYTLRKLAKRAVNSRVPTSAATLIHQALLAHWQIIFEEPLSTSSTLVSACLLCILPRIVYCKVELLVLRITGFSQSLMLVAADFKRIVREFRDRCRSLMY